MNEDKKQTEPSEESLREIPGFLACHPTESPRAGRSNSRRHCPGGSGDRKEFLADVSSLANTSGGWILYGIVEERDDAGRPTGIPSEIRGLAGNPDAEILRLDSIARDGIEPRIHGLRWRALSLTGSEFVLELMRPQAVSLCY